MGLPPARLDDEHAHHRGHDQPARLDLHLRPRGPDVTRPDPARSWTYDYDPLGRLVAADSPLAALDQTFAYDAVGNVTSRVGIFTYPQAPAPRLHAPLTIDGQALTYDANGNLVSDRGRIRAMGEDAQPMGPSEKCGAAAVPIEASPIAWRARGLPAGVAFVLPQAAAVREDRRALDLTRDVRKTPDDVINTDDVDGQTVTAWLSHIEADPDELIVVSWSETDGVTMPWRVFLSYWQRMCHHGADECAIMSAHGNRWVLEWAVSCKFWKKRLSA